VKRSVYEIQMFIYRAFARLWIYKHHKKKSRSRSRNTTFDKEIYNNGEL